MLVSVTMEGQVGCVVSVLVVLVSCVIIRRRWIRRCKRVDVYQMMPCRTRGHELSMQTVTR